MIAFSGRDYLRVTVLTNFIKGVHGFQRNRQMDPGHWHGWEPLP